MYQEIVYEVNDPVAVITMNRPDEEREAAPRLIESREQVAAATLPGARR